LGGSNTTVAPGSGAAAGSYGPQGTHTQYTNNPGAPGTTATGTQQVGAPAAAPAAGASQGTLGPHQSRLANKLDPRVNTGLDHGTAGAHAPNAFAGPQQVGASTAAPAAEGTFGPHGSRIANAPDPRVDSDQDGGQTLGVGQASYTGAAPNTVGPHKSGVMNKLDPTVKSNAGGKKIAGYY